MREVARLGHRFGPLLQGEAVFRPEQALVAAIGLEFEIPNAGDDVGGFAGIAAAAALGQCDGSIGALVVGSATITASRSGAHRRDLRDFTTARPSRHRRHGWSSASRGRPAAGE
jgi:hypothetical protein